MAHGYNPYRDHGKFASGPHQALINKEGRHRASAAKLDEQVRTASAKVAAAKTPGERAALKGKVDKLGARRDAQRAGAQAAKSQRQALAGKTPGTQGRVSRAKSAKAPEQEQRDPLTPKHAPPKPAELTKAVAGGGIPSADGWSTHGLTPEAQRAVRGHFDSVVGAYGLSARPGLQSHELIGYPESAMGGAAGWHMNTGKIALSHDGINALVRHGAQDHEYVGRVLADGERHGGFDAYHAMMHETIHDNGPRVIGDSARRTHVEEMTTEMSARHISAQQHGVAGRQMSAGYNEMIEGSVGHVARVAGVSRDAAFDAVAKASIQFKSSGAHFIDAGVAHRQVAWSTLEHLGAVSHKDIVGSQRKHDELLVGWHQEAQKLTNLSATLNPSGIL